MKEEPHPWRYVSWEHSSWWTRNFAYSTWGDEFNKAPRLCTPDLPVFGMRQTEESLKSHMDRELT